MNTRIRWAVAFASPAMLALGIAVGGTSHGVAQQPPAPPVTRSARVAATTEVVTIEQLPAGVEVQMRGPVHQAFAQPYPADEPMIRIERPVPAPLRERPAAARPTDPERTAEWIPGYWSIDPETNDFLWVSGVWRFPPPGQRWVPGYWYTRDDISRWVSGFWIDEQLDELAFVPQPPEPRDTVPADDPPSENHFWVPGVWVYDRGEFAWEPGTWAEASRGWVWEPARYLETPSGWVFVEGYWDYEPQDRGLMFAPIRFDREVVQVRVEARRPVLLEEVYWPQVAIQPRHAMAHWFTQPAYSHYFFGNYYDPFFAQRGIVPWAGFQQQPGFYDPLFWYFQAAQPAMLNQWVQARNRVIAQPTLQPPTVFQADVAAAQLPDFVRTTDMLMQGDQADAFARVEADVLDRYGEQLQQYGAFTDELLSARADLGDAAAAEVQQETQQLEQQLEQQLDARRETPDAQRTDDAPQAADRERMQRPDRPADRPEVAEDRRPEARPDAPPRDPAAREEAAREATERDVAEGDRRPDPPRQADARRPQRDQPDARRGDTPPEPATARPGERQPAERGEQPEARRDIPAPDRAPAARERVGERAQQDRVEARREPLDPRDDDAPRADTPRAETTRDDAPRALPADPRRGTGADPRPPSGAEPRPGAPADARPGSPADPRPGSPATPPGRAEARGELDARTGAAGRGQDRTEARAQAGARARADRQPEASPQQLQPQPSPQQLRPQTLPQPQDAPGAGTPPGQRMDLNRLRQIQMPDGLPQAQGPQPGAQPRFTPPQGRPGLQPGRGGPGASQGAPGGRGLLNRRGR